MINDLMKLSQDEREQLYDAIPMITVLIAGADGEISEPEREWAKKVTHIRGFNNPEKIQGYYEEVEARFESRVEELIENLPLNVVKRNVELTEKLSALNPVLSKLGYSYHKQLHKSFLSFAKHVARADGGFLGIFAIDKDEKELIDLSMLEPVS
ncbi:MAG: hypothetical protein ACI85O_000223 [Saprospiraceae bacterium]|jgi:hypothetical protein